MADEKTPLWYVVFDGIEEGPISTKTLLDLVIVGRIKEDTQVRKDVTPTANLARKAPEPAKRTIPIPATPEQATPSIKRLDSSESTYQPSSSNIWRDPLIWVCLIMAAPLGYKMGAASSPNTPGGAGFVVAMAVIFADILAALAGLILSRFVDSVTSEGRIRNCIKWSLVLILFLGFSILIGMIKPARS